MNTEEIISDLRSALQSLEDIKTQINEEQENIWNTISVIQSMDSLMKEGEEI